LRDAQPSIGPADAFGSVGRPENACTD